MTIYSKKLAAAVVSAGSSAVIFTAPAGVTTVIRCYSLASGGSGSCTGVLVLSGGVILPAMITATEFDGLTQNCRHVLAPGDTVTLDAFGEPVSCWLSGYELS